jgi:hypothetical protein
MTGAAGNSTGLDLVSDDLHTWLYGIANPGLPKELRVPFGVCFRGEGCQKGRKRANHFLAFCGMKPPKVEMRRTKADVQGGASEDG